MITRLGQLGSKIDELLNTHNDMIIHTGSYMGEKKSIDDPTRYLKNIQNTFNYLEQARTENKKFVYISTWDTCPSPYTNSKRACEKMIQEWHGIYGVKYLIIQIPSIIGKGVVNKFLDAKEEVKIDNRELIFLTLDEVAVRVVDAIKTKFNETTVLYGRKIEVQLLYDLIKYFKNYKGQNG